ncbi:hypothetical protein QFZ28_000929 [Neobacillus niacini]|nr:hypothetical protein [Neobacillus niacini]
MVFKLSCGRDSSKPKLAKMMADLSIAPILPDGNTSTAAQMIGLNAVRFIQNEPDQFVVDDSELVDFL